MHSNQDKEVLVSQSTVEQVAMFDALLYSLLWKEFLSTVCDRMHVKAVQSCMQHDAASTRLQPKAQPHMAGSEW
jgi:hypothetical protein